jgi:DNA polymerase-3 subunit delta'
MPSRDIAGLSGLLGQPQAGAILRRSAAGDGARGTFLFSGPDGVGKATAAVALAQALACGVKPGEGCADCDACRRMAQGQHPDLRWLLPAGPSRTIGVDEVREEIRLSALAPHEERMRVVVVDEADRLTPQAANVFLKTLEEPSQRALYLLVTAQPGRLLPTLLSRCRRIRFAPLPPAQVAVLLERRGIAREAALAAAAIAEGSSARAALLCDPETMTARVEAVSTLLGAAARHDAASLVAASSELSSDKERLPEIVDLALLVLRDARVVQAGMPDRAILEGELGRLAAREAQRTDPPMSLRLRALLAARDDLEAFVSPSLALDALVLRLRGQRAGQGAA